MTLYVDALASFWRDWVVNYDAGHQQTLAVSARSGSQQAGRDDSALVAAPL